MRPVALRASAHAERKSARVEPGLATSLPGRPRRSASSRQCGAASRGALSRRRGREQGAVGAEHDRLGEGRADRAQLRRSARWFGIDGERAEGGARRVEGAIDGLGDALTAGLQRREREEAPVAELAGAGGEHRGSSSWAGTPARRPAGDGAGAAEKAACHLQVTGVSPVRWTGRRQEPASRSGGPALAAVGRGRGARAEARGPRREARGPSPGPRGANPLTSQGRRLVSALPERGWRNWQTH